MSKKKYPFKVLWLFLFLAIFLAPELAAQDSYFQFAVHREGVYKITSAQAAQLGAASVDEVSIYGNPGMLPQLLDDKSLALKEIPVKKIDGELFFFLSAADQLNPEAESTHFQPNYYTDTLYYQVRIGEAPTSHVPSVDLPLSEATDTGVLYRPVIYKNPKYNLLSSGRDWYGERVFDGETITLNFEERLSQNLPVYYQGGFMAQSLSPSTIELSINQNLIRSVSLPSVTNSTYGIKGQTGEASGMVNLPIGNNPLQAKLHYKTGDRNGTGYLDYFLLGYPYASTALAPGIYYNLAQKPFTLQTNSIYTVWEVSDFFAIQAISNTPVSLSNTRKLAVFDTKEVPALIDFDRVNFELRQDPIFTELIIITHPSLRSQAERLSNHKQASGISSQVVVLKDIYSSFGYGNPDITAIRNFLAFHYHQGKFLKNVLLFGKGTFDYKQQLGGRPNLVPTYSSRSSLNPLTTYSSDDYYGFLEFGEGLWEETPEGDHSLDIGVGRLPVINISEARSVVDKNIQYTAPSSHFGEWKRKVLFVADDGDHNVHLNDSESLAAYLSERHPELILEKLYLDSFEQIPVGSSQKSPEAKATFETLIDSSSLIVNYIGHGNETTLMAEELFNVSDLNNWRNNSRLPLYVTATCQFGRHDSPLIRSAAEELLVVPKRGAIALLSTGRPVFSNINFALNQAFIQQAFKRENGQSLTLGEIFKRTKNNSLNGSLNRNFSLLGDPSLRLALPELTIEMEPYVIPGENVASATFDSKSPIYYKGKIIDPLTGAKVSSFEGDFEVILSDKPSSRTTLGDESMPTEYQDEQIYLHRGKGTVINGEFEGSLWLPETNNGALGEGRLKFFAKDKATLTEAFGADKIEIDGTADEPITDRQGPEIQLSIDPPQDGNSVPSTTVQMMAVLKDSSGININPLRTENEITIRINEGEKRPLNTYYHASNGHYTEGRMTFPISGMREGKNQILFEAFDNLGNASSVMMEIIVSGSTEIRILSQLVFPNPSTSLSQFHLTHNRTGENLLLELNIYSLSGNVIFSQSRRFPKANTLLNDLTWSFMSGKSNYPAKGTYLYILTLKSEFDGTSDRKSGKLIIQ